MAVPFITEVKRTHTCGALDATQIGQEVVLFGWVNNRRDHGGAVFIDLRDREGLTQVVFEPDFAAEAHELAGSLRLEFLHRGARQGGGPRRQREPRDEDRRHRGEGR